MKYVVKSSAVIGAAIMLSQPALAMDCIDTDGDGWGWNGTASCIASTPRETSCIDTIPLNDGWGWNGISSCRVETTELTCIDSPPTGDGWGWDGVSSCRIDAVTQRDCIDTPPLGDGWGWNGAASCTVATVKRVALPNGGLLQPTDFYHIDGHSLFDSYNSQFYSADTSGYGDVFVLDHVSGEYELISGSNGDEANNHSYAYAISPNSRYVVFGSLASNLSDAQSNGSEQIYFFDRESKALKLISANASGTPGNGNSYGAKLSDDANTIVYYSTANSILPDQFNPDGRSVYVYNRQTSETTQIPLQGGSPDMHGMSANGKYVLVEEREYVIDVAGFQRIFYKMSVFDTQLKTKTLLFSTQTPFVNSKISNDGQKIVFESLLNYKRQVSVLDRASGEITLEGVIDNSNNADTRDPVISPDGKYIAFVSGDTDSTQRVYIRNLQTKITTEVTVPVDGNPVNGDSYRPKFSSDSSKLFFTSESSNLIERDNNNNFDLFIYQL